MNESAVILISLGVVLLSLNPSAVSLAADGSDDGPFEKNLEYTYNVTTSVMDDAKEFVFTIRLKCRGRTSDVVSCRLEDPQYHRIYHDCNKSADLCNHVYLRADFSYVGRFEVKYRSSMVQGLFVSSDTSLKQLSFYRIIAGLIFPGVDVSKKPEGTYSLVEESVYGKCEALVKVVRTRIKNHDREEKFLSPPSESINETRDDDKTPNFHEMLSVKRTRNLETCYPVPALLVFDKFFYHPVMTSVHYDIKSSISRMIVRERAFTSYTSEDIAVKNVIPRDATTMLHVGTLLTLHSIEPTNGQILSIYDPVAVELPFVNGFDPLESKNAANDKGKSNDTENLPGE